MAARLTTFVVVAIVAVTLIAGLIVGAQRDDSDGPVDLIVHNARVYTADRQGRDGGSGRDPRQPDPPRRQRSRDPAAEASADHDDRREGRRRPAWLQRRARRLLRRRRRDSIASTSPMPRRPRMSSGASATGRRPIRIGRGSSAAAGTATSFADDLPDPPDARSARARSSGAAAQRRRAVRRGSTRRPFGWRRSADAPTARRTVPSCVMRAGGEPTGTARRARPSAWSSSSCRAPTAAERERALRAAIAEAHRLRRHERAGRDRQRRRAGRLRRSATDR